MYAVQKYFKGSIGHVFRLSHFLIRATSSLAINSVQQVLFSAGVGGGGSGVRFKPYFICMPCFRFTKRVVRRRVGQTLFAIEGGELMMLVFFPILLQQFRQKNPQVDRGTSRIRFWRNRELARRITPRHVADGVLGNRM